MTTTPTARDHHDSSITPEAELWSYLHGHLSMCTTDRTAARVTESFHRLIDAALTAARAAAAAAAQQDWETARITIAAFEQEVARLREALVEVADWFDTRPLSDLGIVGIGYIGPEVVESADAVADIVRAALRAAPVAADGCRGDSEAERNRLRYLLNKAGDLIVGMGISDWQRPVWERDRWDLLGEMDEALGRSPNPHTAGLSAWKERP